MGTSSLSTDRPELLSQFVFRDRGSPVPKKHVRRETSEESQTTDLGVDGLKSQTSIPSFRSLVYSLPLGLVFDRLKD